ncbi:MAG: molybdate ABC transporter permease subunit [Armatimonadetes bacterium CG_4_10_14_0_8_um_filter_66_14]|nr:ABC transporter permease subunit [Armatimonadota bacterium]PIZ37495.1 MAG: molybdate ABC transporter permease subunit [Armatimonadetes bacterium CG_4_10_14_0_8_um_filter_66_14]
MSPTAPATSPATPRPPAPSAQRGLAFLKRCCGGAPVDPLALVAVSLTAIAVAFIALPCVALVLNVRPAEVWHAMGEPWVQESLLLSLKPSVVATLLCVLFGSPAASALARVEVIGSRLIDAILQLPLVLPPVVAGGGLLLAFGRRGLLGNVLMLAGIEIPFTTAAVVLAQVFMGFPMHVQAACAGFQNVPKSIEEASRALGAGSFATLLRVTIPLSWPALVSGAILCWGRAMGEFGATIMFAGNMRGTTRTMPLAFSAVMFIGARWALSGVAGVQ